MKEPKLISLFVLLLQFMFGHCTQDVYFHSRFPIPCYGRFPKHIKDVFGKWGLWDQVRNTEDFFRLGQPLPQWYLKLTCKKLNKLYLLVSTYGSLFFLQVLQCAVYFPKVCADQRNMVLRKPFFWNWAGWSQQSQNQQMSHPAKTPCNRTRPTIPKNSQELTRPVSICAYNCGGDLTCLGWWWANGGDAIRSATQHPGGFALQNLSPFCKKTMQHLFPFYENQCNSCVDKI